jgi:hypothetical protein
MTRINSYQGTFQLRYILPLMLVLAAAMFVACGSDEAPVLDPPAGQTFTLPSADGDLVALSELTAQGETIVIFYRGNF